MTVLKPAVFISFFAALLAFVMAPTRDWSVAGLRALMVFGGVFLSTGLALSIMSRLANGPAGSAAGPKPEGSGEGRFVDMEKHTIDRSKLQDLLQ